MSPKTLKALKASIKHWEENVAAETPQGAGVRGDKCALCQKFASNYCSGCPVFKKTLKRGCDGTPYFRAYDAYYAWKKAQDDDHKAEWCKAAQAEVVFLKSLLPRGTS